MKPWHCFIKSTVLVLLAVGAVHAPVLSMAAEEQRDFVPFGIAVEKWNRGDRESALRDFIALAQVGDTRSQLLLAMALLEGKDLPKDVPQGFAWLEIASAMGPSSFGNSALDLARKQKASIEPMLSGADLIMADRIAGEYFSREAASHKRRLDAALSALKGGVSTPEAAVVTGCALDRSPANCNVARTDHIAADACTQGIQTADSPPDSKPPKGRTIAPEYPPSVVAKAWEGAVIVLAHVDRSGYVCRAAILQSSGLAPIDAAVLDSVRAWRFSPGLAHGQPVEATAEGKVDYMITDYALGQETEYQRAGKVLSQ